MLNKNDILNQKISFFEKNSPYFNEVYKIAKDFAVQNMPILVYSKDIVFRKWFSELVCYSKYSRADFFCYLPCSVVSSDKIVAFISNQKSGTVLLMDQIEKLSLDAQRDVLSLIDNESFIAKKITLIAGTSVDLEELTEADKFSKSLAFRLNLLKINLLSVSENKNEILALASYFLGIERFETGKDFKGFTDSAKSLLQNFFWKGGAGELKAAVSRAVIFGNPPLISAKDFDFAVSNSSDINSGVAESVIQDKSLKTAVDSFKRFYVKKILEENGNNQTKAAKVLGLQRTYVSRLMNELDLR
ncbi:MAG: sigma 54-interacting transcriptional regulator [Treponema sp.]|nr:sigma 54-interacting transcriptional regulator [Treponema sp.]